MEDILSPTESVAKAAIHLKMYAARLMEMQAVLTGEIKPIEIADQVDEINYVIRCLEYHWGKRTGRGLKDD